MTKKQVSAIAKHSPKDISAVDYLPPSCIGVVPKSPLRLLVIAARESGLRHVDDARVRLIGEKLVEAIEGGLDGVDDEGERILRLDDDAEAEGPVNLANVAADDVAELNHVLHCVIELRAHQAEKELQDGARRGGVEAALQVEQHARGRLHLCSREGRCFSLG